ncbi:MAG TPA: HD domain-containing phosphohydrolase [Nitrospinota bacterium]|nr:HD domain-containing phosphohydrolase [Nitrospinota bacterium]
MNDMKRHLKVDNELIIVFLLVVIIGLIYFLVPHQKVFLNFFYIPVLLGSYLFGKKHGTYSAFLSVLMVFSIAYFIPETFTDKNNISMSLSKWLDITTWGCFLIIVGYLMGALYEKKEKYNREIKKTYQGIITMLSLILDSVDQYTQNHSIRVAKYSEKIAKEAGLSNSEIEDIKIASLLHDLGKIGVSAEILHKIGKLSDEEKKEITGHTGNAKDILEPIGGRVLRILPLIINHHERQDGNGYNGLLGDSVPMGAKIIAVADVYDALTADRPYRKALSPLEVKEEIVKGSGTHFDPEVVKYFENVFPTLEIEEPALT